MEVLQHLLANLLEVGRVLRESNTTYHNTTKQPEHSSQNTEATTSRHNNNSETVNKVGSSIIPGHAKRNVAPCYKT